MAEVFKPRKNMVHRSFLTRWECVDEKGLLACDGGPSIIWGDGGWSFYIDGRGPHRLDGPAVSDGEWHINNINVTDEIHTFAEENNIDLENLTDEDKVLIALKFG